VTTLNTKDTKSTKDHEDEDDDDGDGDDEIRIMITIRIRKGEDVNGHGCTRIHTDRGGREGGGGFQI
jgi:hypothetical protein